MECQICFEHFDSRSFVPKVLVKCGHSFCKVCLERIICNKAYVTCPVCRENTKFGKKETLPTNYSLVEIIEKTTENEPTKNLLEKYKFFDDKQYKNVTPVIVRHCEPRKLTLKKIVNNDFIYVEEFENNQNYSLFSSVPKRNRRYNFNQGSLFSYFFNEFSYSIAVYRKASKCRHSFSCLELIIRSAFSSICMTLLSKIPLLKLLKYIYGDGNLNLDRYTFNTQCFIFAALLGWKGVFRCLVSLYIDEIIKSK